jgi:hypothetical protein
VSADWGGYLDHLEVAVLELEHALAEGEPPQWSVPEPPDGTPPDETLYRRDALLSRMVVSAHTIEQLRDGIRAEIEALPAPRPRAALAYAGTIGTNFDYRG